MESEREIPREIFGKEFSWGISSSALQTEGSTDIDGRGLSIWDVFAQKKNKIYDNHSPKVASDFYRLYENDLSIVQSLQIPNVRLSISWPRIIPSGIGAINPAGLDFYKRLFESCLRKGIQPWVTLYHWDLPWKLEQKGGWTNRDIINWFSEYAALCSRELKDFVQHWMILNEPVVFTGAGHFLGIHAPGRRGLKNFLPAIHHALLAQSAVSKIIRSEQPNAQIGSTFSCSQVVAYSNQPSDIKIAKQTDALLNRLFIEPSLGLGYPYQDLPIIKRMGNYMMQGDEENLKTHFDFIGIQYYTRLVVRHSFWVPLLRTKIVQPHKRKVYRTAMNWEVYPEGLYEMLKKFNAYGGSHKIIVTENGAAFHDEHLHDKISDHERIQFIMNHIRQVARAKREGLKADGYFVWSLTDNFEWAEGYRFRFGLVYVDYQNQKRTIKDSGYWYGNFINSVK